MKKTQRKYKLVSCLRCEYQWFPNRERLPITCANCRSAYWNISKMSRPNLEEKNGNWAGDKVGYIGLHRWVKKRLLVPDKCPNCKLEKKLDLMNKTGIYNRDFKNWGYLCRKCHMEKDGFKERIGSKNPFYGKRHTSEHEKKMWEGLSKWREKQRELKNKQKLILK